MAAWNDILKAKLETLLGERGTGKDAALRRGEADALLTKAATLAAAKAEKAAKAQASEALTVARRAEAAVQSMVASVAETTVQTSSDDTAQNERLFQAMSDLFQWNGATYTLRVPASGLVGRVKGDQIARAAIDIAKFAAGLQPVEIVSALPTTDNFEGRMAYLVSGTSDQRRLYRYTGSAWVNTNAVDQIVGKLIAGQIEAGAIGAEQLAANAVSARHLAVGDFTNFVPNGRNEDFTSDPTVYWSESLAGGDAYYSTVAITSARSLAVAKPTGDLTVSAFLSSRQYVPVQSGAEYYGETAIRCDAGTTTAGAYFRVLWYDADKVYLSDTNIVSNAGVTTTFQTFSKIVTAPAGACFARFRIYNHSSQTTARIMYFDRLLFWRANAGQLIVDGSITSSHVDAVSFGASGLALFGGELRSTNFVQGSTGWRIKNDGTAELESLIVRTRHLAPQTVSADWNSYTAAWLPLSSGVLLDVQTLTISDPTVNGCVAWITFSCQIGMTRSTAGRGRGSFSFILSDDAGTRSVGDFEVNQYLPAATEMQMPVSITRRVVLTGSTANITINAWNLDCDTFRFRYRRLEVNVMKK